MLLLSLFGDQGRTKDCFLVWETIVNTWFYWHIQTGLRKSLLLYSHEHDASWFRAICRPVDARRRCPWFRNWPRATISWRFLNSFKRLSEVLVDLPITQWIGCFVETWVLKGPYQTQNEIVVTFVNNSNKQWWDTQEEINILIDILLSGLLINPCIYRRWKSVNFNDYSGAPISHIVFAPHE